MQKLTLKQLATSADALRNLSSIKLPVKISYQLARLNVEVDNELRIYEEKRKELINEFGKKNEETGVTSIDPSDKESVDAFYKKFEELSNVEVEIQFANKINLSDLGNIEIEPRNLPDWLFETN